MRSQNPRDLNCLSQKVVVAGQLVHPKTLRGGKVSSPCDGGKVSCILHVSFFKEVYTPEKITWNLKMNP